MIDSLKQLQKEQAEWSVKNFGFHPPWHPLLGVCEEAGELCHAVLKGAQKIRHSDEQSKLLASDAVGDIVIYLADFCTCVGLDLDDVVKETWKQVKQRDWTKETQKPEDKTGHE